MAIFANHQNNWTLLLKASQFLSVLLAAGVPKSVSLNLLEMC